MGASPRRVVAMVVGQGMIPVLIGIAAGVAVALAATRLMSSLLFGIVPSDPATYVTVAVLLAVAAVLSSLLPALQAVRIDPVTALRNE
jgi:ABC-type antimicrobial peptide transport system permease subunit